ncbi:M20 family metallopeptidase [Halodesulfurarchaeum sp. HSR-GB]|uniref:M20 family metallopeptidase n=1 Tax=Halodesulfurarchaeum sp. HSR-GB TaxID=3074077 RepID=UPI00286424C6|nr:M20 family metallopeptidase [Halodesulfurarchaeum sp. HSR-GB]MDR5656893.1 M20 family metallopeptidase [Halodesulfurarchaeum sp. HSR-GB]
MSFDPIEFLETAVETPSTESVTEMRELVRETLEANGETVRIDDAGNLLADKGSGEPRIVLNTHLDTVPPHHPLERTETEIRGRGSCDAKGPLAAILAAFLRTEPETGRLTLALTPDEERESTGAAALELDADGFIVGEPTGLDVCVAARGRFQGTVHLGGRGAHAATPESGVNAISGLKDAIAGLESYDDEHGPATHPRLGAPTLTPTLVSGGEATNRIPSEATLTIDRRSVPPERAPEFFESLQTHLRSVVSEDLTVAVQPAERETPFLEGFETDADAAVSQALVAAGAGEPRTFGAATEAAYFASMAPTVVFGPGVLADEQGPVAHGEREYVPIDAVRQAGAILTDGLETLLVAE